LLVVVEITGTCPGDPLDTKSGGQFQVSTTPGDVTADTITTTQPNELIFAGASDTTGVTGESLGFGPGEIGGAQFDQDMSNCNALTTESQVLQAAGPVASTFTATNATEAVFAMQMAFSP
jgi:hypothetical protein